MCRPVFEQTARLSKMFFLGKKGYEGKQKSPENRTFKLYVFRIKYLRYEFVFPGERPHAHNNTQASGSHFIEPLVGHRGVPEVILGAHHEISRGQVTGIKILLYQLGRITRYQGKAQPDRKP